MDSGSDRLSENVGFHGSVNHQNSFLELRPNGAKIAGVMRQDCGGYAPTTLPLLGRTTGVRQQLY